jgi:hypothetical protein
MPRVTLILEMEGFEHVKYNLDEMKLMANEVNDPFVGQFIAAMTTALQPYKVGGVAHLFLPLL